MAAVSSSKRARTDTSEAKVVSPQSKRALKREIAAAQKLNVEQVPLNFFVQKDLVDDYLNMFPQNHLEFDGQSLIIRVKIYPEHEAGATEASRAFDSGLQAVGVAETDINWAGMTTMHAGGQVHEFGGCFYPDGLVAGGPVGLVYPGTLMPQPTIAVLVRNFQTVADLNKVIAWALTAPCTVQGIIVVQIWRNAHRLLTNRLTVEYYNRVNNGAAPVQLLEVGRIDDVGNDLVANGTVCTGVGTHQLHIPIADYFFNVPVPTAIAAVVPPVITVDCFRIKRRLYRELGLGLP
eukprot:TRINITY_DN4013_c1_g3_i1.p1 TRINITY_DN4013_c1_g3~~TRINITY_DN4013_c1_g3_i1.p1  ORF type:complete len:292 (+),score=38.09 TRINITY_DN4013_c1_g3_i1:154-1029(+)